MNTNFHLKTVLFSFVINVFSVFNSYAYQDETLNQAISVEYGVICRSVIDRVPLSTGDAFPNDVEKLYCFTHIRGIKEPSTVVHQWLYEGEKVFSIELPVNSPSWRTYSAKKILPHQTGEWKVEVLDNSGILLKQIFFIVQGE